MNQNFDVIIIGTSTRAAAFSAIRAGLRPLCLDQFADADLAAVAPARRITNYPLGLLEELQSLPTSPLIYVGGLENHPRILQEVSELHALWGNSAATVQQARDPQLLTEAARLARVKVPETRPRDAPPAADGAWLIRPRHGSGGRGIEVWNATAAGCQTLKEPHLFQQRIAGEAYSASFLAPSEAGDVRFIGVTRQLIGLPESHGLEFQWCGNIGPVALDIQVEHLVRRFGNVLKWKAGVRGLFGVDFVLDEAGTPWVVDVNPRYPGSLELLEHATGTTLLADHAKCFTSSRVGASGWDRAHSGEFLGKAIYYAPRTLTAIPQLAKDHAADPLEFPMIADLPQPGQPIPAGCPVCTVFATGASADATLLKLRQRLREVDEKFSTAVAMSP